MTLTKLCHPPLEIRRKLHLHQRWLESGGLEGRRFKAFRLELEEVNLDGYDLSVCAIQGDGLLNCSLRGTWFVGASLCFVNFEGSDLAGARFDGADLDGSQFIGVRHRRLASFKGTDTTKTIWTMADKKAADEDFTASLKRDFEERSRWTDADRKSYKKRLDEIPKLIAMSRQESIRMGLDLWRKMRSDRLFAPESLIT